jgi:hypothetical protein
VEAEFISVFAAVWIAVRIFQAPYFVWDKLFACENLPAGSNANRFMPIFH